MSTEYSYVDVIVVRDKVSRIHTTSRSSVIDETPLTLTELETINPIGSERGMGAVILRMGTDPLLLLVVIESQTLRRGEKASDAH